MAQARADREEAEKLVDAIANIIDIDRMDDTLLSLRYKKNFYEIIYSYVTYIPPYDSHMWDHLTLEEWNDVMQVIDLKEYSTIVQYRAFMNKIMKQFPNLRGKNAEQSLYNMKAELVRLQQEEHYPHPFLNWMPMYGGILCPKLYNGNRYRKWAIENQLTYLFEPNVPVTTVEGEMLYNQEYMDGHPEEFTLADDGFLHDDGPVLDD